MFDLDHGCWDRLLCFTIAFRCFDDQCCAKCNARFEKRYRGKINRLPVSYFDKNQQGNILSRVTNDVDAVSGALQQAFIGVVNAF